jgi:hypothetical protein
VSFDNYPPGYGDSYHPDSAGYGACAYCGHRVHLDDCAYHPVLNLALCWPCVGEGAMEYVRCWNCEDLVPTGTCLGCGANTDEHDYAE